MIGIYLYLLLDGGILSNSIRSGYSSYHKLIVFNCVNDQSQNNKLTKTKTATLQCFKTERILTNNYSIGGTSYSTDNTLKTM